MPGALEVMAPMTRWTPTDYNPDDFANRRHIGPSPAEMAEMLAAVGAPSLDALIDETVPRSIRQSEPLAWAPLTEAQLLARMREVEARNHPMTSLTPEKHAVASSQVIRQYIASTR